MGWLVKWHNGEFQRTKRVYKSGPGSYLIRASDYEQGGTPPDDWVFMGEDVEVADFVLPWSQPTTPDTAYQAGELVYHNGSKWRSQVNDNVWEPGVANWQSADSGTPAWVQPSGATDAYPKDFVVAHAGKLWRSLLDANVWGPGVANWRETALVPPGIEAPIPDWVQPTGAGDAYQIGDRVRHANKVWVSNIANNVWEPGVFGWTEVA